MKSIKKRFKESLAEIDQTAGELAMISANLEWLSEINGIATQVLSACKALRKQTSDLKKSEFREMTAGVDALAKLEEIIDIDAISSLEDRFFDELNDHAEGNTGEFFQQLLDKIDRCYTKMLKNIQQLCAVLEEK